MIIDDVITPEDAAGTKGHCKDCAVARLLKRHGFDPTVTDCDFVLEQTKYIDGMPLFPVTYDLPLEVCRIVEDFDDGKDVVGRRVRLEIPEGDSE